MEALIWLSQRVSLYLSRPKSCLSLKNVPGILFVRRSLSALEGKNGPEPPRSAPLILAHKGSTLPSGSSMIELPFTFAEPSADSPDRACYGTFARDAAPYQSFRDSTPCLLRATPPPKGAKLAIGRGTSGEHYPQPTRPLPRLNRPAKPRSQPVDVIS